MASSTFGGLNNAMSGLRAAQLGLDITSQNLSNVNTEGYSRQRVVQGANPGDVGTLYGGRINPGTGVTVTAFERIRDLLIDRQIHTELGVDGDMKARQNAMEEIEIALPEPTDRGLRALSDKFWASLQALSNQPGSAAARQAVLNDAATLAEAFNTADSDLALVASNADVELANTLKDVNDMAAKIADLTKNIKTAIAIGESPNELQDRRDLLLDKLAALGNLTYTKTDDGSITVDLGGFNIVSDTTATAATEADLVGLNSGALYGLQQVRDVIVPKYRAQLDAIAGGLISAFNAQHALGFDRTGAAGRNDFFLGTGAGSMQLNPAFAANGNLIAASGDGSPGSAANALALSQVPTKLGVVGADSYQDAYKAMINAIGAERSEAGRRVDNQASLLGALTMRRDSVSSVSLDEEMTNLVKFQRAYEASSRALTTYDEILDRIINRTGRVGL